MTAYESSFCPLRNVQLHFSSHYVFVPTSYCKSTGFTAHTRTFTQSAPSADTTKGRVDERLLLFHGCLIVESSRDGVIRHDTAAVSSSQQQTKILKIVGFSLSCLALAGCVRCRHAADIATTSGNSFSCSGLQLQLNNRVQLVSEATSCLYVFL